MTADTRYARPPNPSAHPGASLLLGLTGALLTLLILNLAVFDDLRVDGSAGVLETFTKPQHLSSLVAVLVVGALVAFKHRSAARVAVVVAWIEIAAFTFFHVIPFEVGPSKPYWGEGTGDALQWVGLISILAVSAAIVRVARRSTSDATTLAASTTVPIRWLVVALAASVLGAVGVAAAAPTAYELSQQRILVEGRAVAALVRAGDAESVYTRFTPDLARAVPLAQVEQVLTGAIGTAPIGARTTESALPIAPSRRSYNAVHRWGKRTIELQVLLDVRGRIAAINLAPPSALPRDPHAGRRLRARLSLPFRGRWWVFWGGPTQRQNYHAIAPDQRHAYDFVVWRNGATYRGAGTKNADYWAWGEILVAPAAGIVVQAVDGVRDNRPPVQVENRNDPAGNHVVLDLGNGEYALVAHMQKGSVRVRNGDRVRPGDVLGVTGNSGNSSEPHLHFHIQDQPGLFSGARGLPISFVGYGADGRRVDRGSPIQGQFVEREGS